MTIALVPALVGVNEGKSRYLDSDQLDAILPGSRSAKKRWRLDPDPELRMPDPIVFAIGGRNYWVLGEIESWLQRVAEHRKARLDKSNEQRRAAAHARYLRRVAERSRVKHAEASSGAHGEGC